MERLLEVPEVGKLLGLSEKSVRDKARTGELPAVRVGREWRFMPSRLQSWLESGGNRIQAGEKNA